MGRLCLFHVLFEAIWQPRQLCVSTSVISVISVSCETAFAKCTILPTHSPHRGLLFESDFTPQRHRSTHYPGIKRGVIARERFLLTIITLQILVDASVSCSGVRLVILFLMRWPEEARELFRVALQFLRKTPPITRDSALRSLWT